MFVSLDLSIMMLTKKVLIGIKIVMKMRVKMVTRVVVVIVVVMM